jgi:L-lactate dehydrogenase (cytochrome)
MPVACAVRSPLEGAWKQVSSSTMNGFEVPALGRFARLEDALSVADVRELARRRVPRPIFDFVDGGAGEELTLRDNLRALSDVMIAQRTLVDVARRDASTSILGTELSFPVMLAPTGGASIQHPDGDVGAARAAAAAGTRLIVSSGSSYPVGEVASASGAPPWFQTYATTDRSLTRELMACARAAKCEVLVITTDCQRAGLRVRDARHRVQIPARLSLSMSIDVGLHPLRWARWCRSYLRGPGTRFGTFAETSLAGEAPAAMFARLFNLAQDWDDIAWLRDEWQGPLVIKGIMTGTDTALAVEHGVDGIVVSNHGGRQLDGVTGTLRALPEVRAAIGDAPVDLLIDGGIRRGGDVFKALALGARACLIGRPWQWGLGAGGQRGVERVLEILRLEFDYAMVLAGVASVADIGPDSVRSLHPLNLK